MTKNLVSVLRGMNTSGERCLWHPVIPCPELKLAQIERRLSVSLPAVFREILLAFGAECSPAGAICLTSWQQLIDEHEDPYYEALAGTLIIGGDGGGNTLFVDVDDRLGFGPQSVFVIEDSDPETTQARYLAESIEDLFARFLEREDYWDYLNDPVIGSRR